MKLRYWSVCVGFLYIVSFVDASSSMCMQRSRNGCFWSFSGSMVNLKWINVVDMFSELIHIILMKYSECVIQTST